MGLFKKRSGSTNRILRDAGKSSPTSRPRKSLFGFKKKNDPTRVLRDTAAGKYKA